MYKSILKCDKKDVKQCYEEACKLNIGYGIYCFYRLKNGDQKLYKRKAFIMNKAIYVKMYRSRKYYQWLYESRLDYIDIRRQVIDEEKQWQNSWKKVFNKLQASSLWPDLMAKTIIGLSIGYKKIKRANEIYDMHGIDDDQKLEMIKAIDPIFIKSNCDGVEYIDDTIMRRMLGPAVIKKMYFGKYRNKIILCQIKAAIAQKTEYSVRERVGYDVSFSYNGKSSAWYSEEYRDCGNGHYYIALDATHALFIEDD